MPTRFYLDPTNTPDISPAFDAAWEVTGTAVRRKLLNKLVLSVRSALADVGPFTVPITTTEDILGIQFISDPIPAQVIDISNLFSLVIRVFENATTNNVDLDVIVKVVSNDGTVVRGTLLTTLNTGTEFPVSASAATRIVSQSAVSKVVTQPGDRLVIEVGGDAIAPSAGGSFTLRCGNNASSDFALTAGLTTDLNPWCEFSNDLFSGNGSLNNYQSVGVGNGMSTGERIR